MVAMKNIQEHRLSLRDYMIRVGSLSEKHDRRAKKEGFAKTDGDSDGEFSDNDEENHEKLESLIPPLENQQFDDSEIPTFDETTFTQI